MVPPRKATGTKTATSTRVVAMTGPMTSPMALTVASFGPSFSSCITRSTFSTTTIASSQTMPMASTSPRSVSRLRLNSSSSMPAKVPTTATRIATVGISVARTLWRNSQVTRTTRITAITSVSITSAIEASTTFVVSKLTAYSMPSGNDSDNPSMRPRTRWATASALEPGCW